MGLDNVGFGFNRGQPITMETLILPETVIEDLAISPGKILKPIFDLVWNACGYPATRNFDGDGNWVFKSNRTEQ